MGMKKTDIPMQQKFVELKNQDDAQSDIKQSCCSMQDAYAIQSLVVDHKCNNNERLTGRKIGLTSLAMQELLGVNEPDYGVLTDCMTVKHDKVERYRLIQPKIEAEFAFVLKKDLYGPNVSADDVVDATEYVAMAFEIVDSRICDWKIGLIDTIADNGSSRCIYWGLRRFIYRK
jgi:2-keto-4-pentenoate hydratase